MLDKVKWQKPTLLRLLRTSESRHRRTIGPSYRMLFKRPLSSKPLDGSYFCLYPGSTAAAVFEFTDDWFYGDFAEFRSGNVRSVYVNKLLFYGYVQS